MISNQDYKKRNDNIFLLRSDGMTYQSIADLYGISKDRVRQIFDSTLRKQTSQLKALESYKDALSNGDVLALADYLRHKVSIANPEDQYYTELCADKLEQLYKENQQLKKKKE